MADEIKISQLPEASALSGSEIFPLVQGGVTKQVELDSLSNLFPATYSYIVGATGNYPGTPTGLQAAITAAAGSPIFIQPGFSGTGNVTLGANTKFVGGFNENLGNNLYSSNGFIFVNNQTDQNITILTCQLVWPTTSATLTMDNICYTPPSSLFSVSTGSNATYNFNINNSRCQPAGITAFALTVTANVTVTLNIAAQNSTLYGDNAKLFALVNNGADSLSAIFFNLYSSSSRVSFRTKSTFQGYGAIVTLNVNQGSYHEAPMTYVSGSTCVVYLYFFDALVNNVDGYPLLEGNLAGIYINQANVTYIYGADFISDDKPVITSSPGTQIIENNLQNISFVNAYWASNSTLQSDFIAATGSYITSAVSSPKSLSTNIGTINHISTAPNYSNSLTSAVISDWGGTIALGTAYQNLYGEDLIIKIYVLISSATAGQLTLAVGPGSSPGPDIIMPALTTAVQQLISVDVYLPKNQYFILDKTGTLAQTNTFMVTGA